ncbi:MAG: formate dehydrogenase [Pseudomonadota bacterium]
MSQPTSKLSRRTIFTGAGTVGAVAAAASLVPSLQPVAETAATPLKPPPARGGGYSLSEHVKRYYKTTLV